MFLSIFIFFQVSYSDIVQNYYSSESNRIAQININELTFKGDSLYRSIDRIARSNYKQANLQQSLILIEQIPLDSISSNGLYWNVQSFKAMILTHNGFYTKADSVFKIALVGVPDSLQAIQYRVHLNYSYLKRRRLEYDKYIFHLEIAKRLATNRQERDKVIRNLARRYIRIEKDRLKAMRELERHTPEDSIADTSTLAGFLLIQAEIAQLDEKYTKAKDLYEQANRVALGANLNFLFEDIENGYFRTYINEQAEKRKQLVGLIMFLLFVIFVLGTKLLKKVGHE